MSNSPLVSHVKISPFNSGAKTHRIDRITPHCVVGQCTVESLGNLFQSEQTRACSNYGIGYDGRVGMYCEESDISWCSSSRENDNRAVTIEIASDTTHPYEMRPAAYDTLIDLCVDICRRNGIRKLLWMGSKEATLSYEPAEDEACLSAHRWFANKSCPGDWLYSRYSELAEKVTEQLSDGDVPQAPSMKSIDEIAREVIAGSWGSGDDRKNSLIAAGYDYDAVQNKVNELLGYSSPSAPAMKSIDEIAREVIAGSWGSGEDRKNSLVSAGYDYDAVQNKVNELLGGASSQTAPSMKSIDEIAREVIAGSWGSGSYRKDSLLAAGYDYDAVQKKVNELLAGKSNPSKSIDEIAREVIAGSWGSGDDRKKKLVSAGYDYNAVQNKVNELLR